MTTRLRSENYIITLRLVSETKNFECWNCHIWLSFHSHFKARLLVALVIIIAKKFGEIIRALDLVLKYFYEELIAKEACFSYKRFPEKEEGHKREVHCEILPADYVMKHSLTHISLHFIWFHEIHVNYVKWYPSQLQ